MTCFEFDQTTEDVEQVQEFCGVFSEPCIGLDAVKARRRSAITHDGSGTIKAPVAEPLHEYLFAGYLILPYFVRDVFDEPLSYVQFTDGGIIVDTVRKSGRLGWNAAGLRYNWAFIR